MCGIVGFWHFNSDLSPKKLETIIQSSMDAIQSRGPDDHGYWLDPKQGFALGHQRLAILDLSQAGHQPMISQNKRYVICYNGEIYNYRDLQKDLYNKNISLNGHSDTETLLEYISCFGLEETLSKLIGMFAFALWDIKEDKLFLARDRMGIKPLYWGWNNNVLFFGSQLKSFFPHPNWQHKIDQKAIQLLLKFNYIPNPHSIYKDIYKLEPGHFISIEKNKSIQKKHYWSISDKQSHGTNNILNIPENEAIDNLESLLKNSIEKRMIADVPLGVFLSGGVDSSVVTALMQSISKKPINSFSIGFHEKEFDEAPHAKEVAQYIGTNHHELYISSQEALDVIPKIPQFWDEPFADSSQIPTYLLSSLTKNHVTVALSGDGGDELFAGYNRYLYSQKLWSFAKKAPYPIRKFIGKLLQTPSPKNWDRLFSLFPNRLFPPQMGDKIYKTLSLAESKTPIDFYNNIVSFWDEKSLELENKSLYDWPECHTGDFISQMQFYDMTTYLPEDILTKVDRASMAVGLEARVPLIDHRVVEWSFHLPMNYKIRQGQSKWILRQVLYKHVPKELIERPKMGFGIPLDQWLRGPLKEWAFDLLSENKLSSEYFPNKKAIQKRWQDHLKGKGSWQHSLWGVLMFQAWKEKWIS